MSFHAQANAWPENTYFDCPTYVQRTNPALRNVIPPYAWYRLDASNTVQEVSYFAAEEPDPFSDEAIRNFRMKDALPVEYCNPEIAEEES